jgi:hypothetical protein
MARPIRHIEIYLSLDYNDGQPIPESKYLSLQRELLNRFGGVKSVQRQFPLRGIWRSGTTVFRDRVGVFTVMDFRDETETQLHRYLFRLKSRLKRRFEQLEVLITVAELLAI